MNGSLCLWGIFFDISVKKSKILLLCSYSYSFGTRMWESYYQKGLLWWLEEEQRLSGELWELPLCSLPKPATSYHHLGSFLMPHQVCHVTKTTAAIRLPPQFPVPSQEDLSSPIPTSWCLEEVSPTIECHSYQLGVLQTVGPMSFLPFPLHLHELTLFILRYWHLLVFHSPPCLPVAFSEHWLLPLYPLPQFTCLLG